MFQNCTMHLYSIGAEMPSMTFKSFIIWSCDDNPDNSMSGKPWNDIYLFLYYTRVEREEAKTMWLIWLIDSWAYRKGTDTSQVDPVSIATRWRMWTRIVLVRVFADCIAVIIVEKKIVSVIKALLRRWKKYTFELYDCLLLPTICSTFNPLVDLTIFFCLFLPKSKKRRRKKTFIT